MNWTRRSLASPEGDGTLRLVVSASATTKLPTHLRLFARATRMKALDNRPQLQVCPRCHDYHNINACNRHARCGICAADSHNGPCSTPIKCLNCAGPHPASSLGFPDRPLLVNGVFVRPDKNRLRNMRQEGHRALAAINSPSPPLPETGTMETLQTKAVPEAISVASAAIVESGSRFAPMITMEEQI